MSVNLFSGNLCSQPAGAAAGAGRAQRIEDEALCAALVCALAGRWAGSGIRGCGAEQKFRKISCTGQAFIPKS